MAMLSHLQKVDIDVNGILQNDYFFSKTLNVRTKNASGIEWSALGELSGYGTAGSVSASYPNPDGFSLENFRIKSDGRVLAQASLKVYDSTKFVACIEDGRQEPGKALMQSYGKLGLSFSSPMIDLSGDVDIVNGPVLSAGFFVRTDTIRAGGEVVYNTHWEDKDQRAEVLEADIGASVDGPDWTASLRTMDLFNNIRLAYVHRMSEHLSLGSQVDYRVRSNYQTLSAGLQWKPDERTTLKGKVSSDGNIAGSLRQRLADFLELIVCTEVDAKEISSSESRFGLGLEFR